MTSALRKKSKTARPDPKKNPWMAVRNTVVGSAISKSWKAVSAEREGRKKVRAKLPSAPTAPARKIFAMIQISSFLNFGSAATTSAK